MFCSKRSKKFNKITGEWDGQPFYKESVINKDNKCKHFEWRYKTIGIIFISKVKTDKKRPEKTYCRDCEHFCGHSGQMFL